MKKKPPPDQYDESTGAIHSVSPFDFMKEEGEYVHVLLVPTDFTPASTFALEHAQKIGHQMNHEIVLLHVIEHEESERETLERMEQQVRQVEKLQRIHFMLTSGKVSEKVPQVAEQLLAEYIILGSEEVKLPRNHKFSTSLKLLEHGNIPYITVQERPRCVRYDQVVFPVDYTDENECKHQWLERLCDYHMPTFHLLRPHVNEADLRARVDLNVAKAVNILSRRGTPYSVTTVEGKSDYSLEILQYARSIDADLLVVTTSFDPRHEGIYMLEPHERRILLQAADIPVMSINPAP